MLEPAVESVYMGNQQYIVDGFQLEKSKFINATIEFNLKSSYIINECSKDPDEFIFNKRRFFTKCPLGVDFDDSTHIYVESKCSLGQNSFINHYEKVLTGVYAQFGIVNKRIVYRKINAGLVGKYSENKNKQYFSKMKFL